LINISTHFYPFGCVSSCGTQATFPEDPSKQASVLIPLVIVKGKSLLFTARPLSLNAHRGELCFPGVKFDEHYDKSIEDSAPREPGEELGIDSVASNRTTSSH